METPQQQDEQAERAARNAAQHAGTDLILKGIATLQTLQLQLMGDLFSDISPLMKPETRAKYEQKLGMIGQLHAALQADIAKVWT